jgi:hypothetical protein
MRVCASYSSGCQLVAFIARAGPAASESSLSPDSLERRSFGAPQAGDRGPTGLETPRRRPRNSPPPGSANEAEAHRGTSPSPRHRRPHPPAPSILFPKMLDGDEFSGTGSWSTRGRTPRPRARSNLRSCSRKRSSRAAPSTRPPRTMSERDGRQCCSSTIGVVRARRRGRSQLVRRWGGHGPRRSLVRRTSGRRRGSRGPAAGGPSGGEFGRSVSTDVGGSERGAFPQAIMFVCCSCAIRSAFAAARGWCSTG